MVVKGRCYDVRDGWLWRGGTTVKEGKEGEGDMMEGRKREISEDREGGMK